MGGTVDKQGMIDFYSAFWSAFPDAKIEPVEMIVGDELVAVRLHVKGTIAARSWRTSVWQRVDVEEITIFKLDDEGRCTERWVRLDELSFLQQIGAMPAPAAASA